MKFDSESKRESMSKRKIGARARGIEVRETKRDEQEGRTRGKRGE